MAKASKAPAKIGRPSKYTPELADEICARIAQGESLVHICSEKAMPSTVTIWSWLDKRSEFLTKYTRAREAQAEFYANQIIDIADETPVTETPDPDGGVTMRVDSAGVQRNKLRVDARKWIAARLLPKKYGEKIQNELSGEIGIKRVICDI
jgi:hypothetical protein